MENYRRSFLVTVASTFEEYKDSLMSAMNAIAKRLFLVKY